MRNFRRDFLATLAVVLLPGDAAAEGVLLRVDAGALGGIQVAVIPAVAANLSLDGAVLALQARGLAARELPLRTPWLMRCCWFPWRRSASAATAGSATISPTTAASMPSPSRFMEPPP